MNPYSQFLRGQRPPQQQMMGQGPQMDFGLSSALRGQPPLQAPSAEMLAGPGGMPTGAPAAPAAPQNMPSPEQVGQMMQQKQQSWQQQNPMGTIAGSAIGGGMAGGIPGAIAGGLLGAARSGVLDNAWGSMKSGLKNIFKV